MFGELFTQIETIKEYQSAPLVEERLRYLVHYAEPGASRYTLRAVAANQLSLVRLLDFTWRRRSMPFPCRCCDQGVVTPRRSQVCSTGIVGSYIAPHRGRGSMSVILAEANGTSAAACQSKN